MFDAENILLQLRLIFDQTATAAEILKLRISGYFDSIKPEELTSIALEIIGKENDMATELSENLLKDIQKGEPVKSYLDKIGKHLNNTTQKFSKVLEGYIEELKKKGINIKNSKSLIEDVKYHYKTSIGNRIISTIFFNYLGIGEIEKAREIAENLNKTKIEEWKPVYDDVLKALKNYSKESL